MVDIGDLKYFLVLTGTVSNNPNVMEIIGIITLYLFSEEKMLRHRGATVTGTIAHILQASDYVQ
jgi:hypothetical protein